MGDPPFGCGVESDGKGSAEPDGRKGDVSCGDITCDCTVTVTVERVGEPHAPVGGVTSRAIAPSR